MPFYSHFKPNFCHLHNYLSQNWCSDGHFKVLNRSKSQLVQKLWHKTQMRRLLIDYDISSSFLKSLWFFYEKVNYSLQYFQLFCELRFLHVLRPISVWLCKRLFDFDCLSWKRLFMKHISLKVFDLKRSMLSTIY